MITYSLNYNINGQFHISKNILFLGWFACVSIFSTTIKSLEGFFQNVQLHKLQHWLHYNFVCFIHLKKKEKALFVLVKLYYGYRKF